MKTRKLGTLLAITVATVLFTACSETLSSVEDTMTSVAEAEKSTELSTDFCGNCDFTSELSEAEIAGLMEMREEEKLAHDVYVYYYDLFNHIVFKNISASEDQHTSAVLRLIDGYGLEDPALTGDGEFRIQKFIDLYSSLTTAGNLTEALIAGALIEETDIADLKIHLAATEVTTLNTIYSHLLSASKIHLKAFTRILAQMGETYTPAVLSEEEYNIIITSESNIKGNGFANGSQYGKNNSSQRNQNNYSNSSNSTTCDVSGPNF